jgi:hypothetical protein
MQHTIRLIEKKEVNDEYVAFQYRCCDDPSTDSWMTIALSADFDEAFAAHKARMAQSHEHKVNFRSGSHPMLLEATKDHQVTL